MKMMVIGLDGANWNLLSPWIEQGKLPNLKYIRDNGVWSDMESCLPPVTSPNWKCYSTGKNPGKLGVFWWEKVDFAQRTITIPRSSDFDGLEIWNYLGMNNIKVGIINTPTTYPPKMVNGFLISGGPDAMDYDFTYPKELESKLKNYGYRIHAPSIDLIKTDSEKVVEEIYDLIDLRFQVAYKLIEEYQPDFLQLTIYYTNVLQHHFWDEDYTLKAWKIIDARVGELVSRLKDTIFIFMSDHGSNKIDYKFNINTWLEKEGYLSIKKKHFGHSLSGIGLNRDNAVRILTRLGLKDFFKKRLSESARNFLPTSSGAVRSEAKANIIDWEKTKVLASGQGPIYINVAPNSREYETIKDELIHKLTCLKADGVHNVAKNIFSKEEIYAGKYLGQGPDLIIDQNDGIHITPSIGFKSVFERPDKWKAENKKTGIFMAYGPNISKGAIDGRISIVDVTPTILHIYGVPIPSDMDGRVLKEIFEADSELCHREIKYSQTESSSNGDSDLRRIKNENEEVAKRLKALGYL